MTSRLYPIEAMPWLPLQVSPDGMVAELDGDYHHNITPAQFREIERHMNAVRQADMAGKSPETATGLLRSADGSPSALRHRFKGQPAFLLAGGPSLDAAKHNGTLDAIMADDRVLTMAVNNAPATAGLPDLWCCVDPPDKFLPGLWRSHRTLKFVPEPFAGRALRDDAGALMDLTPTDCPGVHVYRRAGSDDAAAYRPLNPGSFLSETAAWWGLADPRPGSGDPPGARSVLFAALRIAYELGIRTLYLLGVDFQMDPQKRYAFDETPDAAAAAMNNRAYAVNNTRLAALRPAMEARGLHVFNCNPDSKLTAFDHKPLGGALAEARAWNGTVPVRAAATLGRYGHAADTPGKTPTPRSDAGPDSTYDLTVVVTTVDRPVAFGLWKHWIARQTYRPAKGRVQVLVVDDGHTPADLSAIQLPEGYTLEYLRRTPDPTDAPHTLAEKVRAALTRVEAPRIVFMEDGTWYADDYLASTVASLEEGHDLTAPKHHVFYHVGLGRYTAKPTGRCLHATGLTRVAYAALARAATVGREATQRWAVDLRLFREALSDGSPIRVTEPTGQPIRAVKFKGLPGRAGTTSGWDAQRVNHTYTADPGHAYLRQLLGEDVARLTPYLSTPSHSPTEPVHV